jgi:CubicO group peptidase (beta-lactamase class C family)
MQHGGKAVKRRLLISAALAIAVVASADGFEPAYTMEEVLEHQHKVPDDSHWWAVRGPEMGWMHKNTQSLFPSVPVYRSGQVRELKSRPIAAIADFPVQTPEGEMRFEDMLSDDQSTAMGVVILHQGDIVFESYPRMKDYEKVIYWSVAKVFAGTIVRLLEERGLVDISKPIETYISDLAESSFAGTTVRSFLDHATGLDCDENYEDPESCYYQYSMAIGDNVRDETAVDNPYDYFINAEVARLRQQGLMFRYSGANNFILSWLIQEVTGYPFQDIVTREFWQHIGAESDAGFFAYRYGIAVSHGGFHSRMRDLARFGLLFTPSSSKVSEKKIISDEFMRFIRTAGNPNLRREWRNGAFSYPMYQWNVIDSQDWMEHGGWGGQGLLISPSRDVVAVYTSYTKEDYSEIDIGAVIFEVLNTVFSELPAGQH